MSTLLYAISANGKVIGRCDARCYDSHHRRCRCICGGRCHSLGLQSAAAVALHIRDIDPAGLDPTADPRGVKLVHAANLSTLAHPQFTFMKD